ncbi:hypothetical protein GALMADRAFT_237347 [Galerina marginata CBS 339.88]|uniref:F-box domain-containing protein n=1 Tax=Galerina marginata (strain CBS 339.88) TaxID=685588 RepID=A0A067TQA5_GALM3|nr:hypothetical protein GALMADRAFT_237347 [Galerina marginata CBS 339.88]
MMEQNPAGDTAPIETGIHTLPDELLLLIFEMNADMFSDINALKDIHHIALVSKRWRQILLDLPSIWGKLIDLNVLCKDTAVKEEWVNEILRRSEGALLWIRGSVSEVHDQLWAWRFFEPLIKNNWTRIQKLVVDLGPMYEPSPTWQTILQPAPNLERFEVRFYHYNIAEGLSFHAPWTVTSEEWLLFSRFREDHLFANNAPSLREFAATQIYFPLSAPWLSNLRSISFSFPVTLRRTFQAIEQMPLLESLDLERLQYRPDEPILPLLSFARLTDIVLSDFLNVCARVLNRITPAPGCSLSLTALDCDGTTLTTQILLDVGVALSKYLKIFNQSHPVTRIALCCRSEAFSFTDTSPRSGDDPPFFTISFPFGPEMFSSTRFHNRELTALDTLISVFAIESASFPFVRTLNLDLDVPTLYTSLLSASRFSDIEVLHTQESALMTMLQLNNREHDPPSEAFPFPALKTLRLTGIKGPSSVETARISPLTLFLSACRDHGCPIRVLEVYPTATAPRLGYLRPFGRILDQGMVGMMLKVLSHGEEGREVVCGGVNVYRLFLEY